uniref:Uncharacterized protein n=1 Tax=Oryza rufipogon TaxID=4529 RepID=A0A0E0QRV4_ORYRU
MRSPLSFEVPPRHLWGSGIRLHRLAREDPGPRRYGPTLSMAKVRLSSPFQTPPPPGGGGGGGLHQHRCVTGTTASSGGGGTAELCALAVVLAGNPCLRRFPKEEDARRREKMEKALRWMENVTGVAWF